MLKSLGASYMTTESGDSFYAWRDWYRVPFGCHLDAISPLNHLSAILKAHNAHPKATQSDTIYGPFHDAPYFAPGREMIAGGAAELAQKHTPGARQKAKVRECERSGHFDATDFLAFVYGTDASKWPNLPETDPGVYAAALTRSERLERMRVIHDCYLRSLAQAAFDSGNLDEFNRYSQMSERTAEWKRPAEIGAYAEHYSERKLCEIRTQRDEEIAERRRSVHNAPIKNAVYESRYIDRGVVG